ncbi:hypothetical protein SAMN02745124_00114 [Desulfofustis glycolicus DSM 9705]|uniref:Uncharacterized protein n=1 Tax=Desulfofustis glycolicus DSM 9705 TaxID=1121409 RepID=A0A1M5S1K9_9BACT|nr:hypothetical protein SAMN02745124_00114 [Desulfofustis glycolicus DSM 9705]
MDWLQNHILKIDRQYVPLLNDKKVVKCPGPDCVFALADGPGQPAAVSCGRYC